MCAGPRCPLDSELGEVAFGEAAVLALLVEHDQQAVGEREVLLLRPAGFESGDGRGELLGGEAVDHPAHHRLSSAAQLEHLVERGAYVTVPGDAVPPGRLVPRQVERVPRPGIAEHHPAHPRSRGERQVAERLDERPLTADRCVERLGRQRAGTLDRLGPLLLEQVPGLAEARRVGRVHERTLGRLPVQFRFDVGRHLDAVDHDVAQLAVDDHVEHLGTEELGAVHHHAAELGAVEPHPPAVGVLELHLVQSRAGQRSASERRAGQVLVDELAHGTDRRPRSGRVVSGCAPSTRFSRGRCHVPVVRDTWAACDSALGISATSSTTAIRWPTAAASAGESTSIV